MTQFHVILTLFPEVIRQTIENNRKLENNRKTAIFNFFDDFIFLTDREHQNTPSDQISVSFNKKYVF